MKNFVKIFFSFFYRLLNHIYSLSKINHKNKIKLSVFFYRSRLSLAGKHNWFNTIGAINKSVFVISGNNNQVDFNDGNINGSSISIIGNNNKIFFSKGVFLVNSVIAIRGEECIVRIGESTTFGGVRIVNVGSNNYIDIGAACLFSDNIEIWAGDTHNIYNEQHEIINKEKPIIIGDNVWVGSRVNILKGVKIESGSIIGMGTTVVKDIPAASINVGNPNRVVKNNVKWSIN